MNKLDGLTVSFSLFLEYLQTPSALYDSGNMDDVGFS